MASPPLNPTPLIQYQQGASKKGAELQEQAAKASVAGTLLFGSVILYLHVNVFSLVGQILQTQVHNQPPP